MKVLHIITSLDGGGAEGVLTRLCLADRSNSHHVISLMDEGVYGGALREAGVLVSCVSMPRGKVTAKGVVRLWRFIRESRPDVIQTWMYHADFLGGLLGRLAGVRSIVWGVRNSELEPGKSKRSTILIAKLCARISAWVPAKIAVCAEKSVEIHAELGYCKKSMVVVPNGYDLSHFKPLSCSNASRRRDLKVPEDCVLIGMVARFDPFKDHHNLISALGLLDRQGVKFRCLLVGDGIEPGNAELSDAIFEECIEDKVILAGRRSDISVVMNALDLHVLSSLSEAFPNVLAEAMACGIPCVSTDVGDAALILGNTGWIAPSGNPAQLAKALHVAITEFLGGNNGWQARKNAARNRIERKFSMDSMITNFNSIWVDALR